MLTAWGCFGPLLMELMVGGAACHLTLARNSSRKRINCWSRLLLPGGRAYQQMKLASGWQSQPSMKPRPFCDPGWQSQPSMDHNLYTKYLNLTGRLTLIKTLTLLKQQRNTPSTLCPSSLLPCLWMCVGWSGVVWQGVAPSLYRHPYPLG